MAVTVSAMAASSTARTEINNGPRWDDGDSGHDARGDPSSPPPSDPVGVRPAVTAPCDWRAAARAPAQRASGAIAQTIIRGHTARTGARAGWGRQQRLRHRHRHGRQTDRPWGRRDCPPRMSPPPPTGTSSRFVAWRIRVRRLVCHGGRDKSESGSPIACSRRRRFEAWDDPQRCFPRFLVV